MSTSIIQQIRITIINHFVVCNQYACLLSPVYSTLLLGVLKFQFFIVNLHQKIYLYVNSDLKYHMHLRFLYTNIPASHFRCARDA